MGGVIHLKAGLVGFKCIAAKAPAPEEFGIEYEGQRIRPATRYNRRIPVSNHHPTAGQPDGTGLPAVQGIPGHHPINLDRGTLATNVIGCHQADRTGIAGHDPAIDFMPGPAADIDAATGQQIDGTLGSQADRATVYVIRAYVRSRISAGQRITP